LEGHAHGTPLHDAPVCLICGCHWLQVKYDLVIGADGVGSTVRSEMEHQLKFYKRLKTFSKNSSSLLYIAQALTASSASLHVISTNASCSNDILLNYFQHQQQDYTLMHNADGVHALKACMQVECHSGMPSRRFGCTWVYSIILSLFVSLP